MHPNGKEDSHDPRIFRQQNNNFTVNIFISYFQKYLFQQV